MAYVMQADLLQSYRLTGYLHILSDQVLSLNFIYILQSNKIANNNIGPSYIVCYLLLKLKYFM